MISHNFNDYFMLSLKNILFSKIHSDILQKLNILKNNSFLINNSKFHKIYLNSVFEQHIHNALILDKKSRGFTNIIKNDLLTTQKMLYNNLSLNDQNFFVEQSDNRMVYSKYNRRNES
jgi:hypothetical protein